MKFKRVRLASLALTALMMVGLTLQAAPASAATVETGAVGVEALVPTAPPTRGATITVPGNGSTVTDSPVTVSGICPNGLLVKVFSNNIFIGSVVCTNGSYSIQVSLFSGRNDLVVRVYDALDQAGPDSNTVTINYQDAQFAQFGSQLILNSSFAQRGAPPGTELQWPITISGGSGPYAISVDWGDGTSSDLYSESFAGQIILKHTYKSAGVYKVIVKATDKNGQSAFLQLVGQATGAIQSAAQADDKKIIERKVIWWPSLIMLPLLIIAFWLGRRSLMKESRRI